MLGLRLTPCYYGVTVGTARVNASAMTEMRGVHWELGYDTPGEMPERARFPQRKARIAARHATSEYGATAGAVRGVARARVPVPLPENATGKNGGRRARSH